MMCHFERIKTLDCYVSCLVANTVTHSILVLKKKKKHLAQFPPCKLICTYRMGGRAGPS